MRFSYLLWVGTLAIATACAQSYPSAWNYADPNATVLVGLDWSRVQQSSLGRMAKTRMAREQASGLPDLDLLNGLTQALVAVRVDANTVKTKKQPPVLIVLSGHFDLQSLRRAAAKKTRAGAYHSVPLLMGRAETDEADFTMALVSDQTLLLGDGSSVRQAIDRNAPGTPRVFSPTLASAGKLAETQDLWIVAHDLSSKLRGQMDGPLRMGQDITGIEAGFSFRNGIDADAALTTTSDVSASSLAALLGAMRPQLPQALQNVAVTTQENVVHLALSVDQQQLAAMIGKFTERALAQGMRAGTAPHVEAVARQKPEKMTIKIYGLDSGPKEIPFPENQ